MNKLLIILMYMALAQVNVLLAIYKYFIFLRTKPCQLHALQIKLLILKYFDFHCAHYMSIYHIYYIFIIYVYKYLTIFIGSERIVF